MRIGNLTVEDNDFAFNITEFRYIMAYEPDRANRANVFESVFHSTLRVMIFGMLFALFFALYRRRRRKFLVGCKSTDNNECAPVVVTSTTHTTTGGYPVTQMPSSGGVPANVYAASYPVPNMTGTSMGMPMPPQPPMGYQTTQYPPYPPMGVQTGGANMNPPSYDVAVHGVGMGVGNTVPYEKQAPYNPNYSAQ